MIACTIVALTNPFRSHARSLALSLAHKEQLKGQLFLSYTRTSPHSQLTKRYLWARWTGWGTLAWEWQTTLVSKTARAPNEGRNNGGDRKGREQQREHRFGLRRDMTIYVYQWKMNHTAHNFECCCVLCSSPDRIKRCWRIGAATPCLAVCFNRKMAAIAREWPKRLVMGVEIAWIDSSKYAWRWIAYTKHALNKLDKNTPQMRHTVLFL